MNSSVGNTAARRLAFRLRGFARDERASMAVEFSLLAPMFFSLMFAIFIVGWIELARTQLDQAAEIAKRGVLTGTITSTASLQTQISGAIGGLVDPTQVMVNLTPYTSLNSLATSNPTLTYNASGGVSNVWSANFGATGSIMVLQLIYQLPVVSGLYAFATQSNGTFELVSTQVFVRE